MQKSIELFERYPDKDIVIQITFEDLDIDWEEIDKINLLLKEHLILSLSNLEECDEAQSRKIRYYYGYPISTYWAFNNFIKEYDDAEYIILGAPLFFDFPYVQKFSKNIRAIPNIANTTPFQGENLCGTWIRPEELNYYGQCVKCIEFIDVTLEQEAALFHIYMENHAFVGPLSILIKDIDADNIANSFIPDNILTKRFSCRQICQSGGKCRICHRVAQLAELEKLEQYAHSQGFITTT